MFDSVVVCSMKSFNMFLYTNQLLLRSTLFLVVLTYVNCATDYESLSAASPIFAGNLYKALGSSEKNVLISPLSLQTVLALVQIGAKGSTLEQMSRVLSLPYNKTELIIAFSQWHNTLKTSQTRIESANKIYVRNDIDLLAYYRNLTKYFNAEIDYIDLQNSVEKINTWVEKRTNNKIKDIVKESDISIDTVMLLLNALYFKGDWENQFDKVATQKKPFYINGVDEIQHDMMTQISRFNFSDNENLNAKFLELPYTNDEFVMTLVLPNERTGLPELEKRIDEVLKQQQMAEFQTFVTIPKFKIEFEADYVEVLKKMGLKSLFRKPNLTGMTLSTQPLAISKIIQKTYINVNEAGTEAAAATGIALDVRFGYDKIQQFNAEHPFLFIIRHKASGIIEFLGRYNGP